MVPTPATSRSHDLIRAPIANETERAHFQRRLAFSLLVVFILAFGFLVVSIGAHPFVGRGSISALFVGTANTIQFVTTFAAFAGWLFLRKGTRSINFLDAADVLATLVMCWGWDFMATCDNTLHRPELVGLLAVSYTLVTRTAFVPSRTLRTAVIATLSFLPLIPATFFMYATATDADPLITQKVMPSGATVYVGIWAALGVACTSTISYVIYGLRLQVRNAMRLGQYLLETKIGEGGMGVVYRASHAMLRRPTAIKLLTNTGGRAVARFEREVQLTARLTHPNTIAVYDYGRTPDGVFYYAMEYLDGITLDDLVRTHGPQPSARVVHLLLQICGALEEAHAAGLVHRDIKPANIMLTERGGLKDVVKVLDFGLVKESAEAASSLGASSVNAVMGTPHFMAPEAIIEPTSVDGRTDIYALGVTAYYLLTGERTFEGSNVVEICSMHLHHAPVPPTKKRADIPAALERIVLECLAKKQDDRPKSASAMTEALLACELSWTRADSAAWWESKKNTTTTDDVSGMKPKVAHVAPAALAPSSSSRSTQATVTVVLDDRAAS